MEKNVISSKWVFAIKWKNNGTVDKQKAWTIAKGFTQVLGKDYNETYASVAHLDSVRLVCAISASQGLRLWQVDFVSAFLNSDSSFDIYMEQPKGFLRKEKTTAYGNSRRYFMVQYRVLMIGPKTLTKLLTKLLKTMAILDCELILKSILN